MIKLFILGFTLSLYSFSCSEKLVVNELSKYHGPTWGTFVSSGNCNRQQVKTHLENILKSPSILQKYVNKDQVLLPYRNATKSYGAFLTPDSSGKLSDDDIDRLVDLYKESSIRSEGIIEGDEFTSRENLISFFQSNVLESIRNTGSTNAITVYNELLDEDIPAFHVEKIVEYSQEVKDGRVEIIQTEGDLVYSEQYFPNLKKDIFSRYSNFDRALYKSEIDDLNKKVSNFLLSEKPGANQIKNKVLVTMNSLNAYVGLPQNKLKNQDLGRSISSGNQDQSQVDSMTEDVSQNLEEMASKETKGNTIYIILALILGALVIFFVRRK